MARAEHLAERMAERIGRWMLACAIAGTVPLALWGGACGQRPVVEPRPDGGGSDGSGVDGASDTTTDVAPIDRPYAVDLMGTDVGDAPESGADVPSTTDSATDGTQADLLTPETAIDLATDPAGQDFPSVPDAAPGCCAEMTPSLCSADGRSLIMCRTIFGQCNPVGLYGYMWFTQACDNGCFTEGTDGQSGDGGGGPRCR